MDGTPEKHSWLFKRHFRSRGFGWAGSSLASQRLREAISEIKSVAKKSPVTAGDGVVTVCERMWPAFQNIDTSSGALGSAGGRALDVLLPFLIQAPANLATRRKWLNRLYAAIEDDGVDWLSQVREVWGRICAHPELRDDWIDEFLSIARHVLTSEERAGYFFGTAMCLSCLLEAGRYDELEALLKASVRPFWHDQRYWAEALLRLGRPEEAIAYAEAQRNPQHYADGAISDFCEDTLLAMGRPEDAYRRYGLRVNQEQPYITQFRRIMKRYPMISGERILHDLIDGSEKPGSWFASARQAGLLDLARECASDDVVAPATLARAARDTVESSPSFSFDMAIRAIDLVMQGYGYEERGADALLAADYVIASARRLDDHRHVAEGITRLVQILPDPRDPLTASIRRRLGVGWPRIF